MSGGRLASTVAVVTGAASGIGRATAELFAREGAVVAAVDIDERLTREPPAGSTLSVVCDVADLDQVAGLTQRVVRELGGYGVLVNCAARLAFGKTVESSSADWDRLFATNVKGAWAMCRAAIPEMIGRGQGSIVNVASGAGLRPVVGLAAYSASKSAVISLTRSIALEYGAQGIRANCICPGMIDTPMNEETLRLRIAHGEDPSSFLAPYVIKRKGRPDEVANAALFLASSESTYVIGATLAVDAGRLLH